MIVCFNKLAGWLAAAAAAVVVAAASWVAG